MRWSAHKDSRTTPYVRISRLSLYRDTILIFFNDNGTAGGVGLTRDASGTRNGWEVSGYNAGMRGKKTSRYEGGHRAACFIHWPKGGLTGGRDVHGVTAHVDLLPTLIDLCSLRVEDTSSFDGISLKAVMEDKNATLPERSVVVHDQGRFGKPVGEGLLIKDKDYSVMRGQWRLVGKELYDLSKDPGQRNDIADQHPEVAKRLRTDYEASWRRPFLLTDKPSGMVTGAGYENLYSEPIFTENMVYASVYGEKEKYAVTRCWRN